MAKIDVNVPDIGDFKDVPIIEVLVKPGDVVKVDQSLVTLESDKAAMDVPSPVAGAVAEVVAKVGDKVSMGDADRAHRFRGGRDRANRGPRQGAARRAASAPAKPAAAPAPAKSGTIDVAIPDIGDFKDVPIIEILVKEGETVDGGSAARHSRIRQGDDGRSVAGSGKDRANHRESRRQGVDGRTDRKARGGGRRPCFVGRRAAARKRARRRAASAGRSRRAAAQTSLAPAGGDGRSGQGGFLRRLRRAGGSKARARARP